MEQAENLMSREAKHSKLNWHVKGNGRKQRIDGAVGVKAALVLSSSGN